LDHRVDADHTANLSEAVAEHSERRLGRRVGRIVRSAPAGFAGVDHSKRSSQAHVLGEAAMNLGKIGIQASWRASCDFLWKMAFLSHRL
jgi:hypothetical protein